MARMTKQSKENVLIADRAIIHNMKDNNGCTTGYSVELWKDVNASWISGKDGLIEYETVSKAEQAIRRISKNLYIFHSHYRNGMAP